MVAPALHQASSRSGSLMTTVTGRREIGKAMLDLEKRQVPFAISLGLNRIADRVASDESREIEQVFDRPTPFTQRGIATRKSSKRKLSSEVFVKRIQAGYLSLQVRGGTRRPAKRRLVIPGKGQQNRYGNIPKGRVRKLLARQDTFSGRVGSAEGIWQRRKGRAPKLLIAYVKQAQYRPRYDFVGTARMSFNRHAQERMASAFKFARATAR